MFRAGTLNISHVLTHLSSQKLYLVTVLSHFTDGDTGAQGEENLIDTAKYKSQSREAHVMRLYDIFKLSPNIQPTFYHRAKYIKCTFQRLVIITTADTIYQAFTICKALC